MNPGFTFLPPVQGTIKLIPGMGLDCTAVDLENTSSRYDTSVIVALKDKTALQESAKQGWD